MWEVKWMCGWLPKTIYMGLWRNGSASALQAEGCRFDPDQFHQFITVHLGVTGVSRCNISKGKAKIPINKCAAYQPKIIYKN